MSEPTIRPATLDDTEEIASLSDQLGYPTPPERMRERLALLLPRKDQQLFAAEHDGRLVGWLHVAKIEMVESDSFAEIYGLVVRDTERGQGVGPLLIRAAEDWAASHGLPKVRVRCNVVRERTHRFYEREGFVVSKTQKIFDKG
ncbi:MAG: GNAT family N-acetyltransferase [Acidobacteriota bacterium]